MNKLKLFIPYIFRLLFSIQIILKYFLFLIYFCSLIFTNMTFDIYNLKVFKFLKINYTT